MDWELVSDQEFRDLLAALNFEASYDSTKRELTIRVKLVPELTSPDGGRAPLLSVPPAGFMRDARARADPAGGPRCALSCPRQDSNLRTALRRRVLYPLSYGGAP